MIQVFCKIVAIMRDKINSLEINNIIKIILSLLSRVSHRVIPTRINFTLNELSAGNYILMKSKAKKSSRNNSINFLSSQLCLSVLITSSLLSCLYFALVLLSNISRPCLVSRYSYAGLFYNSTFDKLPFHSIIQSYNYYAIL